MNKSMTGINKAKIEDVARNAGVSVATVSRVMNGLPNVREATKIKVLEAMKELSYAPNASARSLRRQESRAVLVTIPNFTNPFYSHILAGIGDCARELDYSALIVPVESENRIDKLIKEFLDSQKADGAILLGSKVNDDWIKKYEEKYCIVQCPEFSDGTLNIPHISIDNYKAMYEMTKYIQSIGHKRIALVINDNQFVSTNMRYKGFMDAVKEAGYAYDAEQYVYRGQDYGFDTGINAARKLLALKERPTAILCISDILALGVMHGADEMGLKVPKDLSVTGFDDVDFIEMFHPSLTTVRQPCYDLGWESMKVFYSCLYKEEYETETCLPYEIKIRESTRQID